MCAINTTENNFRYDEKNHWVLYDDKNCRSRCKLPNCKFFSHLYCQKCDKHFCLTSKRNCFYDYHSPPIVSKQKNDINRCQKRVKNNVVDRNTRSSKQCLFGLDVSAKEHGPRVCRSQKKAAIVVKKCKSEPSTIDLNVGAKQSGSRLCRSKKQAAIVVKKGKSVPRIIDLNVDAKQSGSRLRRRKKQAEKAIKVEQKRPGRSSNIATKGAFMNALGLSSAQGKNV